MEITNEIAQKIIGRSELITEVGKRYDGVRVSSVSFTNQNDEPWSYESGDTYAIVNLRAITKYHLDKAVEALKNDEPEEATNYHLSFNMPVEEAEQLAKRDLVSITAEEYTNKENIKVLGVATLKMPTKAKRNEFDLESLLQATKKVPVTP